MQTEKLKDQSNDKRKVGTPFPQSTHNREVDTNQPSRLDQHTVSVRIREAKFRAKQKNEEIERNY